MRATKVAKARAIAVVAVVVPSLALVSPCRAQSASGPGNPSSGHMVLPATPHVYRYLNVIVAASTEQVHDLQAIQQRGPEALREQVTSNKLTEVETFEAADLFVDGDRYVVLLCAEDPDKVAAHRCDVASVEFLINGKRKDTSGSRLENDLATFRSTGFAALHAKELAGTLGVAHGDTVGIRFVYADQHPDPTFSFRWRETWSYPGVYGFYTPIVTYGAAVSTGSTGGLDFSMLFPVIGWEAHRNFGGGGYIGLGGLAALSIVEAQGTGNQPAQSFTLQRIATGLNIDLFGILILGGGVRWDFTSAHQHLPIIFLGPSSKAYGFLFGSH